MHLLGNFLRKPIADDLIKRLNLLLNACQPCGHNARNRKIGVGVGAGLTVFDADRAWAGADDTEAAGAIFKAPCAMLGGKGVGRKASIGIDRWGKQQKDQVFVIVDVVPMI